MTNWTLTLIPTDRDSSLGEGWKQLSYIWSMNVNGALEQQSILPPVMAVNDAVTVVMWLNSAQYGGVDPSATAAPDLRISGNSPIQELADASVTGSLGSGIFVNSWVWPTPAGYTLGFQNPGFRFRLIANVTPATIGASASANVYTVDPEMVVGPGDGTGGLPTDAL